ncbi:nodulation protein [Acetobacter orientalis]|uniref:Nodulation protein n=1 Tax=Acetobacter orientalis TaxID=146474 RepID=A0A2Z5ZFZ0_9PROT|nr:nodulation protein [Acetobacter orientalis]
MVPTGRRIKSRQRDKRYFLATKGFGGLLKPSFTDQVVF